MFLPPSLKPGDTIGFFSPSAPATVFAKERFERAKEYLSDKGYKLKAGKLTGSNDFYRSGTVKQRAEELNELIRDPDVRCIMSTIGGNNSNSLLPYIDYDALIRTPKIIVGYSDVTALLLAIYQKTGITTFYGPALVASLGEFPPLVDHTFEYFQKVVGNLELKHHACDMPPYWTDQWIEWSEQIRAKETKANQWNFKGSGMVKGRLIGGNLNTMGAIWGSEYMPEIRQGDILLIEDCMLGIEVVERYFALLAINGVFDKVGAIILGKHELFDDRGTGRAPIDVLTELLDGRNIPILFDFDSCHTHPMITIPIGAIATVDFDEKTIVLEL